jgi:hypothetical protein
MPRCDEGVKVKAIDEFGDGKGDGVLMLFV